MEPPAFGLPSTVADPLTHPPEEEWELLELAVGWPDLTDAAARVAERVRVFVITRNPLDRHLQLAPAWATANGDGDHYELVVYVSLGNLWSLAEMQGSTVADVLARLAESAVVVGAAHEQLLLTGAYPSAAHRGTASSLLSDRVADLPGARAERRWPDPDITLVAAGWEPIGLGAVQDLVQAELGPVDLDRTTVRLTPAERATSRCPACAGKGFGFPADLQEHLPAMCTAHAAEATRVTDQRLARAARSNRRGWAAIMAAVRRLEVAPPPWTLGQRLHAALLDPPLTRGDDPERSRARATAHARLVLDLAARYPTGAPFEDLLEDEEELVWSLTDWLTNTMFGLSAAGEDDLVIPVGEAVRRIDPDNAGMHASDLAVTLAERGRPEAVAHAQAGVRAQPDEVWSHIHLGDVHHKLDDPERAEQAYRQAVALVADDGAPVDIREAYDRLRKLLAGQPGREDEVAALEAEASEVVRRRQAALTHRGRRRPRRAGPDAPTPRDAGPPLQASHPPVRTGPKVGRNEPCPCGSGQKYKRCHGSGRGAGSA